LPVPTFAIKLALANKNACTKTDFGIPMHSSSSRIKLPGGGEIPGGNISISCRVFVVKAWIMDSYALIESEEVPFAICFFKWVSNNPQNFLAVYHLHIKEDISTVTFANEVIRKGQNDDAKTVVFEGPTSRTISPRFSITKLHSLYAKAPLINRETV
jgi:hypothetical protein